MRKLGCIRRIERRPVSTIQIGRIAKTENACNSCGKRNAGAARGSMRLKSHGSIYLAAGKNWPVIKAGPNGVRAGMGIGFVCQREVTMLENALSVGCVPPVQKDIKIPIVNFLTSTLPGALLRPALFEKVSTHFVKDHFYQLNFLRCGKRINTPLCIYFWLIYKDVQNAGQHAGQTAWHQRLFCMRQEKSASRLFLYALFLKLNASR